MMRTAVLLGIILVSSTANAQFIDGYSKNFVAYVVMAQSHVNTLSTTSTALFAAAIRDAPDPQSRAKLFLGAHNFSQMNNLLNVGATNLMFGLMEYYSHKVTPRTYGTKRPTKKLLKKKFLELCKYIDGNYGRLQLRAKRHVKDKKIRAELLKQLNGSRSRFGSMRNSIKKFL